MGGLGGLARFVGGVAKYREERRLCRDHRVQFRNFWEFRDPRALWFYRFLEARGLLGRHPGREIAFFSVFGPRIAVRLNRSDVKIFFSGENLAHRFESYRDHCAGEVDLALGFEPSERADQLRLPLWVLYVVDPASDLAGLRRGFARVDSSGARGTEPRDRFCTLVARRDPGGLRSEMLKALSAIGRVDCAGSFRRNTDELVRSFGDDKRRFLRRYRFNLCPENSDAPGYVTEKPFEALLSGCVPIYWGSGGAPEPEILNPDALLLWTAGGDNRGLLARIDELEREPRRYAELAALPRFTPDAAERVWHWLGELEARLDRLLRQR